MMKIISLFCLVLVYCLSFSQTYKDQYGTEFIINPDVVASPNSSTLAAPVGLSSSYTFTLPSGYGNNGDLLQFTASGTVWNTLSSGATPGGNDKNIQFKNGSSFAGSDDLYWDDTSNFLGIGTTSPSYTLDGERWARLGANGTSGTFSLYSEQGGTDYTLSFIANTAATEDVSVILPTGDGASSEILISDGAGQLLWVSENTVVGSFPCNDGQGTGGGSGNTANGTYSFVGGGTDNSVTSDATSAFIGGGTGNTVLGDRSAVISGGSNYIGISADQSVIGSGTSNTILGDNSFVASGSFNYLGSAAHQTFVGSGQGNYVYSPNSGISNGTSNTISTSSARSMIANGRYNEISSAVESVIITGDSSSISSGGRGVIANGMKNSLSGLRAFIGNGKGNTLSGQNSAIVVGDSNTVSGQNSTILGGLGNTVSGNNAMAFGRASEASGNYSVAIGRQAIADDNGSWVFSDQTASDVTSSANNRFTMRFVNGYRFYTNTAQTAGVQLTSSSSAWSSISDSTKKERILQLNDNEIYHSLLELPIYKWNYIGASNRERNYGPMAQDFYYLFGKDDIGHFGDSLTISNMHLASIGVSALKGQAKEIKDLEKAIDSEKERERKLLERISQLEKRLEAIERKRSE